MIQPEDGFMKDETCSCYVFFLIHCILSNKVSLDYKIIYFY